MEYITLIKEYGLLIFTVSEWHALIMLLLVTSSITETAKRTFIARMASVQKNQWIYGTAFVVGAIASGIGSQIGAPSIPLWFWLVTGVLVGPLANMLHWITLGVIAWKFPTLATALKGTKATALEGTK